jgi:predicted nucleic acid-binding protein
MAAYRGRTLVTPNTMQFMRLAELKWEDWTSSHLI